MMSFDDLKLFLPKYLSPKSEEELFRELKQFPINIDSRIYQHHTHNNSLIYQGDGLKEMLLVELPSMSTQKAAAIVLSNTCDIDSANTRYFQTRICYAPILKLKKYEQALSIKIPEQKVQEHILAIKKQKITQIFFLPKGSNLLEDSFVLFDRILNCPTKTIAPNSLKDKKIFTLSNYGLYLFLFKLSIHFTRVREGIDRSQPLQ